MVCLLLPVGVGVGNVAVLIVGTVTNVSRVGDLSLNGGLVGGTVDDAELTDPHAPLLTRDGGGRTKMWLQEFAPRLVEVGRSDSSRVGSAVLSEHRQDGGRVAMRPMYHDGTVVLVLVVQTHPAGEHVLVLALLDECDQVAIHVQESCPVTCDNTSLAMSVLDHIARDYEPMTVVFAQGDVDAPRHIHLSWTSAKTVRDCNLCRQCC